MKELELTCFTIISQVGTARSMFIEAIQEAKNHNFEAATKLMNEGRELFTESHRIHFNLIQKEASGEKVAINLLFLHAEDQLMSAEAFSILADELIDIHKQLKSLKSI